MAFNRTFANADKSLVLQVNAKNDGAFHGTLTYATKAYPFQGSWHNGVTPASTYAFAFAQDQPDQIALGAAGVITGAKNDGQPSRITIAGSAATITGVKNALTSFSDTLTPTR
jgi:hypothetical protein